MSMSVVKSKRIPRAYWLLALGLTLMLGGCDQVGSPTSPDGEVDVPPADAPGSSGRRIVSLAPELTQMVIDLGLGDDLVGVSVDDPVAPEDVTRFGTEARVDLETLQSVSPTHVLSMSDSNAAPAELVDAARGQDFVLTHFARPTSLAELPLILFRMEEVNGTPRLSPDCLIVALNLVGEESTAAFQRPLAQINAIEDAIDQAKPRRDVTPVSVLLIHGLNPPRAQGYGTLHEDLLSRIGAVNALDAALKQEIVLDDQKIIDAQPEVIILLLPGAEPLTGPGDPRLAFLHGLSIPAMQNNRVVLINDPRALLASTSIGHIAGQLAKAVHPELADQIDRAVANPQLNLESTP